jgi:hypothetical protein
MRKSNSGWKLLLVALSFSIANCAVCFAEDAAPASSATEGSGTKLQGGVVEVQITLNDLRDARLAIGRVRKATANLYDEVTRQNVTMSYNPNVIGSSVIMTPTASFSGPILPARKKWVDEAMAEIGPTIKLFKEDIDQAIESNRQTDVSEGAHKTLDPLRQEAFGSVNKSFEIYKQLEGLTVGRDYDNKAIAASTKDLDKQLKQLDNSLKNGIRVLQKEQKAKSRRA